MTKPNFFFIGAPKSGTTSIAYTLSRHPNIFISNPKEPHFFESEINRGITSLKAYEALFKKANSNHFIIGEASTGYLFSESAVPNILNYADNPLFLVCLRNPYEMAISLHSHSFRGGIEEVKDFSQAWGLQEIRRDNKNIPKSCISNKLLLYKDRCLVGDQLERLFRLVSRNKVLLVFFDDLVKSPITFYKNIYNFLRLEPRHMSNLPILNKKMQPKFPSLVNLMKLLGTLKNKIGIYRTLGVANWVINKTSNHAISHPKIEKNIWEELDNAFIPQIKKIENITGRELSDWYLYRK